jgi:hypothetical protein
MKREKRLQTRRALLGLLVVLTVEVSMLPVRAEAQGQGNNAVYKNPTTCCQGSPAFIDASVFAAKGDFCAVLNYVLTPANGIVPSTGVVIDARGLSSSNTTMTCAASPWGSGSSYLNVPSTILLPATGANPIIIPGTWVLPNNTHLVGEGDNDPYVSTPNTKILACLHSANNCSFTGSDMIDLGTSYICDPLNNGTV